VTPMLETEGCGRHCNLRVDQEFLPLALLHGLAITVDGAFNSREKLPPAAQRTESVIILQLTEPSLAVLAGHARAHWLFESQVGSRGCRHAGRVRPGCRTWPGCAQTARGPARLPRRSGRLGYKSLSPKSGPALPPVREERRVLSRDQRSPLATNS